jgi:formylglycine-generating enzyme required for sulfatase activity
MGWEPTMRIRILAAAVMLSLASCTLGPEQTIVPSTMSSTVLAALPAKVGRIWTNSIRMQFVLIRPGEFVMGASEYPPPYDKRHKVKITKPFMMGIFHVTRGQFAAFVKDSGYRTWAERNSVYWASGEAEGAPGFWRHPS